MQIQIITTEMLLQGAHSHINPESDDVSVFFQTESSFLMEELCKKYRTENCLDALRTALILLNFGKINPICPTVVFLKEYSEQINPYFEISFMFLQAKIEKDYKIGFLENIQSSFLHEITHSITQWIDCFGFWNNSNMLSKHTKDMVWNDAATGVRLIVLSYVLQRLLQQRDFDKYVFERILRIAFDHYLLLSSSFFYNPRTNHGLFQNVGLFCFCHSFPWINGSVAAVELAEKRLLNMLHERLSTEGFLKEHSPSYHAFFLSAHLSLLKNIPLSSQTKAIILQYIHKMSATLEPFLLPDGSLGLLGDSYTPYLNADITLWMSENLVSKKEPVTIYPSAGYGFMRAEATQSCVIFAGAFHSRTHKHCDELHFLWSEANENILVDSGMFYYLGKILPDDPRFAKGFWYSDPKRIYTESVHAHNTIEINGESYSRKIKPYGALPMTGGQASATSLYLQSTWKRPEGYTQQRTLVLQPGQWLLALDILQPIKATTTQNADFSQWFHLNPQAQLQVQEQAEQQEHNYVFTLPTGTLWCQPLFPPTRSSTHLGTTEPRLQGWQAKSTTELVPAHALGFHICGREAYFATLFSLNKKCITHKIMDTRTKSIMLLTFNDGTESSFILPVL